MPKNSHLTRRGQTYYLRLRVPKDLLEAYKPKKEITRTLKTSDYKEACKLVSIKKAQVEAEFEKKRKQAAALMSGEDALSGYTDHELMALAFKWMSEVKADEDQRRTENVNQTWSEEARKEHYIQLRQEEDQARLEALNASGDEKHDGLTTAAQFLKSEGMSFNRQSPKFKKLGHFFSKAIHELALQNLQQWQGKTPIALGYTASEECPSFKAVYDEYLANPSRILSQSTKNNYKVMFKAMSEIAGSDIPVNQITREHCKQVRFLMLRLPKNVTAKAAGLSLEAAAEKTEKEGWAKLAPATINSNLNKLAALMEFAVEERYIKENPARGLAVADKVKKKDKRHIFSDDQLIKIFSSALYTGCDNDKHGYNKPGTAKPRNTRFWLPLIGLYSAMRLNEMCQLKVADISVKKGIHVFVVEECDDEDGPDDKSLKTDASIRIVPVHPELIKIGFLDYIDRIKQEGHERLFPDLKLDTRGYYSGDYSKWFSRFLINIGAKTKRTSYHSFRHTFREALREADVPPEASRQLGGWTDETVDQIYGAKSMKPETLYKHISKVSYPDLDLSHLYK